MKLCCISDTHTRHQDIKVPGCDMLIHAGDFTYNGELRETIDFINWFASCEARHKLLVCGNHEVEISYDLEFLRELCQKNKIQLLHNEHTVIEGLTIFGSPYSRKFGEWVYMADEADLGTMYDQILPDTDILITHGPAYDRLDWCPNGKVGSTALAHKLTELSNLKLHVCGHIHESRGTMFKNGLLTVNAAICGIPYRDTILNPITVEI